MEVLVINGSPKGKYSITLQTVLYLQKMFKEDTFNIVNVGQQIRKYEKSLVEIKEVSKTADLILFIYPVYTLSVTSQLYRFLELAKADGLDWKGKFATQLTTSKHFYDVTAHTFLKENALDLGLKYINGLSADMEDLLTEKGQKQAVDFWNFVHFSCQNKLCEVAKTPAKSKPTNYVKSLTPAPKTKNYDILVITNAAEDDASLNNMIDDFIAATPSPVRIFNLNSFHFGGGCLGCLKCASSGKCVYKDRFDDYLRENLQTADATVYAFSVSNHGMGADFKRYDDRQFCNGHRAVNMGKPTGYLVCGDLDSEPNLKLILDAKCEVGHNFNCGVINDADGAEGVKKLADTLSYALDNNLQLPENFLGVGGMKIFRDLIYLMRGLMQADHKFYKNKGFYNDYPQKHKGTMLNMMLVGKLVNSKTVQKKIGNVLNDGMMMPYKKLFDSLDKKAAENKKF